MKRAHTSEHVKCMHFHVVRSIGMHVMMVQMDIANKKEHLFVSIQNVQVMKFDELTGVTQTTNMYSKKCTINVSHLFHSLLHR